LGKVQRDELFGCLDVALRNFDVGNANGIDLNSAVARERKQIRKQILKNVPRNGGSVGIENFLYRLSVFEIEDGIQLQPVLQSSGLLQGI